MSPLTFTVLIGGSMVLSSIIWVYLVIITIREYRRHATASTGAS